ncbi:hypothetical protein SAMN05660640_03031, partial [Pseudomonas sp. NFACC16-2]
SQFPDLSTRLSKPTSDSSTSARAAVSRIEQSLLRYSNRVRNKVSGVKRRPNFNAPNSLALASHPAGNSANSFGQSSSSPGVTLAFLATHLNCGSVYYFWSLVSAYGIYPRRGAKRPSIVPTPRHIRRIEGLLRSPTGINPLTTRGRCLPKKGICLFSVLPEPPQIHRTQAKLQHDQRIRAGMKPPDHPQNIACNKTTESRHPASRLA